MPITKRMKIRVLDGKLEGKEVTAYREINFNSGNSVMNGGTLDGDQDYVYVVEDEDVQMLHQSKVKELRHG